MVLGLHAEWRCVPPNSTEFIVVRHGETSWNASGTLQGQAESELNEVGRKQAYALAERLMVQQVHITAVYSSDLKRAVETAEVIVGKCNCSGVKLSSGLRERHLGKLQGLARNQARILEPVAFQAFTSTSKDEAIPGGGESYNQLYNRSKATMEDIAQDHRGERVVVVTHGGVLNVLHTHASGKSAGGRALNASINIFRISDKNEWTLCSWGDVTHLKGLGSLKNGFRGNADLA